MFIGMISHADDEGRLKGSPLSLKVSIFPADTYSLENIKKWREEVISNKLANYYEVNGSGYLSLPTFRKYQYMTKTFPSKLPAPPSYGGVNNKLITKEQQLYGIGNGIGNGIEVGINETTKKKAISENFDIFWEAYPKHKSKGQAEKAFIRVNPDEQLLATMFATIEWAKKSADWQKDDGKFIPHPATWLNAKGWEDEFPLDKKGGQGGANRQNFEKGSSDLKDSIGKPLDSGKADWGIGKPLS